MLPKGMKAELESFLSPANLGITAATLLVWAIAHVYGVGEAADVIVLVVGTGFVGWGFWGGLRDLVDFAVTTLRANTEPDLDAAAFLFQRAVITLGVNTLLALLLKRPMKSDWANQGRITRMNWMPKLKQAPMTPTSEVTVEHVSPAELKPGVAGTTDSYGNIKISRNLNYREQMKTGWHEEVHSLLAPKAKLLRRYRASLNNNAYKNSVFLRYLTEAAAETRSLIMETRTFEGGSGFTRENFIKGMKFPLASEI